jgi:hypothetical protein
VATTALSTTWFGRSRKKLRSSRGENWVEDSCSATTVRPSSSAMMVMTVPVIPNSKVRASSAVPWKASGDRGPTLTDDSAAPTARATSTDSVGSSHSDPRTYSLSTPRPTMPASAILIRYRASTYPAGQFAKRGAGATAPVARRSRRPGNPCRNCRHAALALMLTAPGQMISRVLGTHQPARSERRSRRNALVGYQRANPEGGQTPSPSSRPGPAEFQAQCLRSKRTGLSGYRLHPDQAGSRRYPLLAGMPAEPRIKPGGPGSLVGDVRDLRTRGRRFPDDYQRRTSRQLA